MIVFPSYLPNGQSSMLRLLASAKSDWHSNRGDGSAVRHERRGQGLQGTGREAGSPLPCDQENDERYKSDAECGE